jgi:tRNA (guanine6-N2)-methyltransferase
VAELFARCLRGVEWVAAAELTARFGVRITGRGHRELRFTTAAPLEDLLEARTVDDVFVAVGSLEGLDHTRESLARLGGAVGRLDLGAAVELVGRVRALPRHPASRVSASFLGRRNYNRFDVEDAAGAAVERQLGAPYRSRRTSGTAAAPLSWRVHLADDRALLGLRLAARPLHRRAYKRHSQPGTLHPPLAAALALISGLRPGGTLLDPFCGVGTVAIEAAGLLPGPGRIGSDISRPAVVGATANSRSAGVAAAFVVADAGRLPFAGGQLDRVVSNLPWRRRVGLEGDEDRSWAEIARVTAPTARMVVLVEELDETRRRATGAGLRLRVLDRISLFGRHPAVVLAWQRDAPAQVVDREGLYGPQLAGELDALPAG